MIFQLATPVKISIAAPMRMAIVEVSPGHPGIRPMNMFSMLSLPLAIVGKLPMAASARGVAPEYPSTPATHTLSPDMWLG